MSVAKTIESKLRAGLSPIKLEVVDESFLHAGHAGSRPGGETHFRIEIVASSFDGLSRLGRQRMVHRLLAAELRGSVHALTLQLATPGEAQASADRPDA